MLFRSTSIIPLRSSESPENQTSLNDFHTNKFPSVNKNNEMLKNSSASKQTTLNTIKRPQLTNYAMN